VICEFGISIVIKILFSFSSSYIQYSLIIWSFFGSSSSIIIFSSSFLKILSLK
jgi:hypothetical protein